MPWVVRQKLKAKPKTDSFGFEIEPADEDTPSVSDATRPTSSGGEKEPPGTDDAKEENEKIVAGTMEKHGPEAAASNSANAKKPDQEVPQEVPEEDGWTHEVAVLKKGKGTGKYRWCKVRGQEIGEDGTSLYKLTVKLPGGRPPKDVNGIHPKFVRELDWYTMQQFKKTWQGVAEKVCAVDSCVELREQVRERAGGKTRDAGGGARMLQVQT